MKKIVIYFGHKLTKADPKFIEKMDALKKMLEERFDTCEFLKFLGVKDGTRADVYKQDILTNIASCDLFVCFVDEESTGLGIEIGAALWGYRKPILVLSTTGAHISRLIGGAVDYNPTQMIERQIRQHVHEDAVKALAEAIELFGLVCEERQWVDPTLSAGPMIQAGYETGRVSGWKS